MSRKHLLCQITVTFPEGAVDFTFTVSELTYRTLIGRYVLDDSIEVVRLWTEDGCQRCALHLSSYHAWLPHLRYLQPYRVTYVLHVLSLTTRRRWERTWLRASKTMTSRSISDENNQTPVRE